MKTAKKTNPNLIAKAISLPLNICGRALLTTYDTCAGVVSLLGKTTKNAVGLVTGAEKRTTCQRQQGSAIKGQIQEYQSELASLYTRLGSEIYHAGESDQVAANIKGVQEDIESLKCVIVFLEKRQAKLSAQKKAGKTTEASPPETIATPQEASSVTPIAAEKRPEIKEPVRPAAKPPAPILPAKPYSSITTEEKIQNTTQKYSRAQLQKMLKNELIELAQGQSLDCKNSMTKNEIIELIMKGVR